MTTSPATQDIPHRARLPRRFSYRPIVSTVVRECLPASMAARTADALSAIDKPTRSSLATGAGRGAAVRSWRAHSSRHAVHCGAARHAPVWQVAGRACGACRAPLVYLFHSYEFTGLANGRPSAVASPALSPATRGAAIGSTPGSCGGWSRSRPRSELGTQYLQREDARYGYDADPKATQSPPAE